MASAILRTGCAIAGLVSFDSLFKACISFPCAGADAIHLLAHRADVAVFFLIIKKLICSKGMLAVVVFILLFTKQAILYKGDSFLLFQQRIVFLGALSWICGKFFWSFSKAGFVLL